MVLKLFLITIWANGYELTRSKTHPEVTIIGVPTNSSVYIDGVTIGQSALRQAGLVEDLANYFDEFPLVIGGDCPHYWDVWPQPAIRIVV